MKSPNAVPLDHESPGLIARFFLLEPAVVATICGLISALGYTAANICLRAVTHLDPVFVSAMKAIPTVVFIGPLLLRVRASGQPFYPSARLFLLMVSICMLAQFGGNVSFQWALGIIGMALNVPLTLGTMIVTSAILGHHLLGDRVTMRMALASVVLITAIVVLSYGAQPASGSAETLAADTDASRIWVPIGVAAACFAGIAYGAFGIGIRYVSNRNTPLPSILFTAGAVGFVGLGSITLARHGWGMLTEVSGRDYLVMLLAGLFNVSAFWLLTKAMQLSSVLFVNALNASQTALAAIAGILLFGEPTTATLAFGIVLTVFGLMVMRGGKARPRPERTLLPPPSTTAALGSAATPVPAAPVATNLAPPDTVQSPTCDAR